MSSGVGLLACLCRFLFSGTSHDGSRSIFLSFEVACNVEGTHLECSRQLLVNLFVLKTMTECLVSSRF